MAIQQRVYIATKWPEKLRRKNKQRYAAVAVVLNKYFSDRCGRDFGAFAMNSKRIGLAYKPISIVFHWNVENKVICRKIDRYGNVLKATICDYNAITPTVVDEIAKAQLYHCKRFCFENG